MRNLVILSLMLAASLAAAVSSRVNNWNHGSVSLTLDRVEKKSAVLADKSRYDELLISGLSDGGKLGMPDVPVRYFLVAAPADGDISVSVNYSGSVTYSDVDLQPTQPPPADIYGYTPKFYKDMAAYAGNAVYPREDYTIEKKMVVRGVAVYQVTVYPVRYNPSAKEAVVYRNTELSYSVSGAPGLEKRLYFPEMHSSLLTGCLNGAELQKTGLRESAAGTTEGGDYLIITHPDFKNAAESFANWKRQLGISTVVADLNQTGATELQITNYIKNAYTTWTKPPKYVLLVGDAGKSDGTVLLPTGYHTEHPAISSGYYPAGHLTGTDLYYAAIDGSDLLPDLAIGRILCDTEAEALVQLNRIMNYEKNPPSEDSFYQTATNVCYFQDKANSTEAADGYAARRFCQTTEEMRDYLVHKLNKTANRIYYTEPEITPTNWNNDGFSQGEPIPSELLRANGFAWDGNAAGISAAINNGTFLLTHRDHGYFKGWGDPAYDYTNVAALNNGNKTPVVFSLNCETGWFDNETDNYSETETADTKMYAEQWVRNTNGGVVGYVGATRISFSGLNDYFAEALLNGTTGNLWTDDQNSYGDDFSTFSNTVFAANSSQPGVALNYAKLYTLTKYSASSEYTKTFLEEMSYFGDPSMRIWLNKPQSVTASCPATLKTGNLLPFTVNTGKPGATVSLFKDGDLYLTGTANQSGVFTCQPSPSNPGTLLVTVSAAGCLPKVITVNVEQGTNPQVNITSPSANEVILAGSTVIIQTQITDLDNNVTKVEFFAGSTRLGEDTSAPFEYSWNSTGVATGEQILKVLATDANGETGSKTIPVIFSDGLPLLTVTSPVEGQSICKGSVLNITVDAEDQVKSVSKVEFFADNQKIGEDNSAPYTGSWNTADAAEGAHVIKVTLADNSGNVVQKEINVTVNSELLNETFSNGSLPAGWQQINEGTGITNRWSVKTTNNAGGSSGEMVADYQQKEGSARLITPKLIVPDNRSLQIVFKHKFDDYGAGMNIKVQSSPDLTNWHDLWSLASAGDNIIGPVEVTCQGLSQSAGEDVYLSWTVTGNLFQFDHWYIDNIKVIAVPTLAIESDRTPEHTALLQNYPNPFNPSTEIIFELAATQDVELTVYNAKGELVNTLLKGLQTAGRHKVLFKAENLNSGLYFYKLNTGKESMVQKMMLIK